MSQSIQLQVTQVGLEQSIAAAMKRVGSSSQINLGTSSKQINALSQPLGRITGQADEFSKSMAAANARVLAFGASAGIIAGVSKAMSGLLTSTIKVEKSLVEISTVLNKTGSELDKFGQDIFNVAKNTGKSFDEVSKGALELARQGLNAEDTLARLNDALILSRLSGLDAAQSVEGLTAAFNSFKSSGITTAEILNKVVAVSQEYAVSERDIIEGLKRSASVANLAGVSFEELAAVITAVQEKTARGGAVIGNAFKTIFSRIQDKAVLSDLDNMGVAVTNLQGEVLPALRILENLADKMGGISQIEQADIAKKLGGVYQLDKLLAALSDLSDEASVTTGALKAMDEAGSKAYQKNAVLNQTLAALLNKVAVSAEQLGAKLGEIGVTDSLKNVLGFFNGLLEGIQKVLGEESGLGNLVRGLVKGLGAFLAGPGLALFGAIILKLSKDLVQFGFASLKAFFGIGKAAKEVQNVEGSISQILAKNVNLQQQLFALEGNRAAQLRLITGALVEQEAVLRKSANISSGLAAPLYNVGARATGSGLRVGNSADGYMPAVAKESKAIKQGVGGARAGDKPVVMPNFNFGGGKKGSIVAHTGEYVVPNFGGGSGSAIFNRSMVQKMGLPSGAKKINAAGGLVPASVKGYSLSSFAGVRIDNPRARTQFGKNKNKNIEPNDKISTVGFEIEKIPIPEELQIALEEKKPYLGRKATDAFEVIAIKHLRDKGLRFKLGSRSLSYETSASVDGYRFADIVNKKIELLEVKSGEWDPLEVGNKFGRFVPENVANYREPISSKLNDYFKEGIKEQNDLITLKNTLAVPNTEKGRSFIRKDKNKNEILSYSGFSTKSIATKVRNNARKTKIEDAVNAASGFIPNFAEAPRRIATSDEIRKYVEDGTIQNYIRPGKDEFGRPYRTYWFPENAQAAPSQVEKVMKSSRAIGAVRKEAKEAKMAEKGVYQIDANALGGIALISPRFGKQQGILDTSMKIADIPFFNQEKSPPINKESYIKLLGIQKTNTPSGTDVKGLEKDVSSIFAPSIVNLAYKLYGKLFSQKEEWVDIMNRIPDTEGQQLLPPAAQGDLFEAASKVALNSLSDALKTNKKTNTSYLNPKGIFSSSEQNRPFDFSNQKAIFDIFGVNVKRGEAKRGGEANFESSGQVQGLIKKVFNDSEYGKEAVNILKGQGAFDISKAQKAVQAKNAFGGFIPNFANPLQDAVNREMSAGIPASQIYVDKSPSLKNAANPMGLMVANRRDEPAGGFQGINRAIKEGANPKSYGAASGFIPNFAPKAKNSGIDLSKFILGGAGPNIFTTSPYDVLKADGELSGGLAYALKYPDRSYAATASANGVKVLQSLYDEAIKSGGKLYYAPHAPITSLAKYGTKTGGMNKRNIFFLQDVMRQNKGLFKSGLEKKILSIDPKNATLKETGDLYDEARLSLQAKGIRAKDITLAFRKAIQRLADPTILEYAKTNKTGSISYIAAEVDADETGSVRAKDSKHPLYPQAALAKKGGALQFNPFDPKAQIEAVTGVKQQKQPAPSFLPYGMRFEKGDDLSKLLGLAAGGFIPNFNNSKLLKQGKDSNLEILDKVSGSYLQYSKNDDNLEIKTAFSYQKGSMLGLYNNLGEIAKKSGKKLFSRTILPQTDRLKSFDENSSIDEILKAVYPQLVYREKSNSKNTKLKLYLGGYDTDLSGKNIFQQVANYFKNTSPTSPKDLLSSIKNRRLSIARVEDTFADGYIPNAAGGFVPNFSLDARVGKLNELVPGAERIGSGVDSQVFRKGDNVYKVPKTQDGKDAREKAIVDGYFPFAKANKQLTDNRSNLRFPLASKLSKSLITSQKYAGPTLDQVVNDPIKSYGLVEFIRDEYKRVEKALDQKAIQSGEPNLLSALELDARTERNFTFMNPIRDSLKKKINDPKTSTRQVFKENIFGLIDPRFRPSAVTLAKSMRSAQIKKTAAGGFVPNYAAAPSEEMLRRLGFTTQEFNEMSERDKQDVYKAAENFGKRLGVNIIKNNKEGYKFILDTKGGIYHDKGNPRSHHVDIATKYNKVDDEWIRGYFFPPNELELLGGSLKDTDKKFKKIASNKNQESLKKRLASIFKSAKKTPGPSQQFRDLRAVQYPEPQEWNHFSGGFIPNFAEKYKSYTPRPSDLFYHGSLRDFNLQDIGEKNKLTYVTKSIEHAMQYAQGRVIGGFGSREMEKNGWIYSYKVNPMAKIFDAKNDQNLKDIGLSKGFENAFGDTEIIQDPNVLKKILNTGASGILQKQADRGYRGEYLQKYARRRVLTKDGYKKIDEKLIPKYVRERDSKKIPLDFGFKGTTVLGIDPEFLIPYKKLDYNELPNRETRKDRSNFYKKIKGKSDFATDGFIPNFADIGGEPRPRVTLTRTPEQLVAHRKASKKAANYRKASGAIGKVFGAIDKASPTILLDGVLSGAEIQGVNLDYIKNLIENNGAIAQMFLGDKGSNFVIQAKKYGITVQQSAMKKLTSLASKALNKVQGLAGGFLPNFANPLQDAVGREMAAGVPASQIYIDKSPALKNAANPMGLMVANRRDEPAGGFQGVNRARREGANPMMYGAAGGFVPNYAAGGSGPDVTPYAGKSVSQAEDQIRKELANILKGIRTKYAKQLKDLEKSEKLIKDKQNLEEQAIKAEKDALKKRIKQYSTLKRTPGLSVQDQLSLQQERGGLVTKLGEIKQREGALASERSTPNTQAKDIRDARKEERKTAQTDSANLRNAVQQSAKRSITNPLGKVRDANSGGNRDMLGTIFALQGAMSALTGSTEGATSQFAKITNAFASVASTATTVVFATQGLSQLFGGAATAAGKLASSFGTLATVGIVAYSAWKEYAKYQDSNNIYITKAGEAAARLAESANKAATNLGNINPGLKTQINKETEASFKRIGYKAQAQKVPGGRTSTGVVADQVMGPFMQAADSIIEGVKNPVNPREPFSREDIRATRTTDIFGGLGADLKNQITESVNQARGVGIPQLAVDSIIEKYTLQGELNKLGEIQIAAEDGESVINDLNRLMSQMNLSSPESILAKFSNEQVKAFGGLDFDANNVAMMIAENLVNQVAKAESPEDVSVAQKMYERFRTPASDMYAKILDPLLRKGADPRIAAEIAGKVQGLAASRNKQNVEEKDAEIARSPRELEETIKAIKREKLERESIRTIEQETAKARYDSSLLVAGIEADLNLSASDRTIKTLEAQAALEKQTAELEAQKTIQEELNKLAGEFMDKNLFKDSDAEDKVRATLKNLKDNEGAQAILSSNNQQQAAIDFATAQLQGTDLSKNITAAEQLAEAILSALDFQEKTNQAVQDGNDEKEKSKNLEIAKNKIQEQNNRLLKEAQSSVSAIADNYAMRASGIAGQLRLNSPRQELALAQYNATTQETDPRKLREDQRKIIDEFFQKQVGLQAEQSRIEAEADFIRNLKVEENIIRLDDNTKATIENTQALIESRRETSFMAGGKSVSIDYGDGLVDEADAAISGGLFNDLNNQINNCGLAILKFSKSIGISTGTANGLASSFVNAGTKIDKKDVQPGDFLIKTNGKKPGETGMHVGQYTGQGLVLQASQSSFDKNPLTKNQRIVQGPYAPSEWDMAIRPGMSVSQATATTVGIGQQGIDQAKKLASENDATIINQKALEYARSLKIGEDNAQGLAEQIKNLAIKMREIGVEKALAGEEQRLKNMAADAQAIQERLALSDARSIKGAMERPASTFTEGMQNGFLQLEADSQDFAYILGKDIPKMFSDGMSGAINSAIEGTVSLKDGLRSAAYEFVKTINQRMMSNLVDKIVGGTGQAAMETGGTGGGGIMSFFSNMFAAGGKVTGGSGSKDDVPAMLMGGEYVVNKRAVAKYGPQFLEAINNGTLAGYAKGGKIQRGPQGNFYTPGTFGQGAIEGKRNLLDFATQTGTSGKFDQMINESGYQSISLEPESSRLSVSGMRNSPMFDATQSAKGQAFDLYLQQYNAEREAKKQEKEQKKALITQLLMLAGSAALGGIGKAAMTGGTNAVKALGQEAGFFDKAKAFFGGTYKGGDIGSGIMGGGLKNYFSGNFGLAYQSEILKALPVSRAIGGMIPSTSGIDTVPAMLSGGEFVMNRSAVQSIGTPNLQSMNAGGTSITSEETSKELNEKLLAKLDELIGSSGSTGNITINVAPSGQTSQETSQDPSASRQQLARQIKDAVLQIINDEKRIGGSLRR